MQKSVLITGASGKVGRRAAEAFARAGWEVRRFRRGTDMVAEAQGAAVIVNGMNPPNYQNWAEHIPRITQAHIAAAQATGARVVIPGNVYTFGDQPGVLDEQTPQRAQTRKGRILVAMEAAYKEAGVKTLILRAGNFIDPSQGDDVLGALHLSQARRGVILAPGDPSAQQAWCYVPDWARAVVSLCEAEERLARFADIPFEGHTASVSDIAQAASMLVGRRFRIKPFPWWLMTLASPVWGMAYEMREMRYLWDMDHRLSHAEFERVLPGFQVTPMREVLRESLDAKGVVGTGMGASLLA